MPVIDTNELPHIELEKKEREGSMHAVQGIDVLLRLPRIKDKKVSHLGWLASKAGFITTPRSTDQPIDHKICGRFNTSIYATVKTNTYLYLNKNHMQLI